MNRLRILAIGAALIAGSSALAWAQPHDRDGRFEDRDHDRGRGHHYGRDRHRDNDRRFRDRDDRRSFRGERVIIVRQRPRVFVAAPLFVGEQRYYDGYNWYWDGYRWCRHDRSGILIYFRF